MYLNTVLQQYMPTRDFPNIFDWSAYIDEHKLSFRINMEELLSGDSNETPITFKDLYKFVKEVL